MCTYCQNLHYIQKVPHFVSASQTDLFDDCSGCADDRVIHTKTIRVGDHVTMTCSRRSAGHILWMRIAFGNAPEHLEKTPKGLNSHIKVSHQAGTLELKIIKAKRTDSAVYLCVRKHEGNITYLNVTYLRVEGKYFTKCVVYH